MNAISCHAHRSHDAPPPLLSPAAKSIRSSYHDVQPKKHRDRFCYVYYVRPRLLFIIMLLLWTGSCDGMKNMTTHHPLPVNNIIHPMDHENSLHDTNDDYRMVAATEKTLIEHERTRLLIQNCVYNQRGLKRAIRLNRTHIDLCSSNITIKSTIAVVSKYINVTCNVNITNGVKCILDAQGLSRHFDVYNATLYFYDIIFINGHTSDEGGAASIASSSVFMNRCDFMNNSGGAIASSGSTLILTGGEANAAVAENNNAEQGGFLVALRSTISITNYLFLNNTGRIGGAIFIGYSTLSTYRCDFMNNSAQQLYGGAIYADSSTLILTGGEANAAVAEKNQAGFAGFLYALSSSISITNYMFLRNSGGQGGGALAIVASTLSTYRCDFMDNYADLAGGAIFSAYSTLTMTGGAAIAAVVENNRASIYGGFLLSYSSIINVTNHLFLHNSAAHGGANFQVTGSSYYENVIFQNNSALKQGGAFVTAFEEDMTLRNVLFRDNNALNGTIRSFNSQIDLKNYSFRSSDPTMDPCSLFVTELFITGEQFYEALSFSIDVFDYGFFLFGSCINFPTLTSINNRRLDTKSIQALRHGHSTILDPNDQRYPSDHLFSTTNTSSETHLSMPYNSTPRRMQSCVSSSAGLRKAVKSAKPGTTVPVCTGKISLNSRARRLKDGNRSLVTNRLDGIDISNKNIIFVCSRKRRGKARCTLDAGGVTRHFYGSDAKVQFHNIRFINGYHQGAGGALLINNSDVTLTSCSFWNNTALSGAGAVFVNQTRFIINGMETNVSQNGGSGAPIEVHSSNATVQNVAFADNTISQFGDGIFVFDSAVDISNLSFNQSSSNMSSNCSLFVAVDPSDLTANATCVRLVQ